MFYIAYFIQFKHEQTNYYNCIYYVRNIYISFGSTFNEIEYHWFLYMVSMLRTRGIEHSWRYAMCVCSLRL